ncbi:energy transducer TonB [Acinetobacter apis]|uniref:Protein TonB n=1 Tax=Acinetobacter apis TaxID=1229165 RepID=A0A217ED16_9GAMM|nr:energy transducer TonB [Acinetobacter apis]SNQ28398.1 outer membrane transport energization protein TonB [Acinetobacter apis]
MNFSQDGERSPKRFIGIGVVVLLHGLLIYALITGLARDVIKAVQAPVEMQIIQEVKPPPPPPPKPIEKPKIEPKPVVEKTVQKPEPKAVPKPAPFVPKPQVAPPTQTDAPKVTTQSERPTPPSPPAKEVTADPVPPAPAKPKGETKGVTGSASASCPTPEYPQDALMNEEQGTVRLKLDVGPDGRVTNAKVEKSSGSRNLDRATVNAYKKCVFGAATQDGTATAGSINLEYTFKLD